MTCPFCGSHQLESLPRGWTFCARCGLASLRDEQGVVIDQAATNHSHPGLGRDTTAPASTPKVVLTKKGMDVTLLSNPRRKPEQWR